MNNQGKPSPYGSLVHKPEHYNILMQLETSRNPDYIKDPFINKNGTAGPLQLRRTAFEDLQKHGWLKDQEYDSISGPMATAAGMKYADLIANHYGLKDPYWNALAYKEGPTLAKKLYDRHKGSIKKALQDSEMPAEGVDYLIKYSKTKLADYAKQTAVSPYIKDMYNTITRGGDINSIDPAKYQTTEVPKFKEGDEVTNPGFLSFPGMTKYTAPFAPAVGMLSNAVGFSANTKSDLFQGAGLGALSGFLSGGLPGVVLGGGASLLAYGSKMAGEENAKYEAEQAELKARTIPGRTGFESPLQYAAEGGPTVTKDTIYPNPTNQFLFEKYKKDGVLPKFIVNETGSTPGRELSGFEKGLKKADDVLSAPARYMVQAITGKYQDPSEAWGYNNPQGFWQNAANVGIDIVADPMNLLGVGIAEKVGFKTIPKLTKLGKASEIGNTVGDVVIKADLDLARKYMSDPKNLKDFYKGKVDSKFNDFVNIAYREMPEIKTVVEKSLKLNKPEVAMALINDAIKIKEGGGNYNKKTPVYPESNFGPLASGYKAAVPNLGMKFQSKVVQKKTIPKKIVQTNNTVEPIKEDDIINISRYNKLVGGVRIPISEKEHAEILSKGKVFTVKGQTIPDNIRPKVRFTEKKEEGGYVEGKQYVLPEYEIKKVPKYQMGNPVEPKYTSMVMSINGPYSSELQKFLNDKNTQVVPMSMDGTNSYTATNDPFYDSNEPLKDLDPIQITANRIYDPLDVMYKVQTLNNFAKGTKRDKQLTSIFETISKLKDKPLLNKLNVTNNKFKLGGEPDIVPPGNLSPLQTEKDEFVIHPNFDVTKSAARLPHSAMTNEVTDTLTAQQTDEQGNVIAPGAYVVSADKKMAIPKSLAEQVNLGIAPAYYSEDMHLPQAEEMNFAKLLYGGKVRMTPAELTKATLKKYPKSVRNEDEDLFAEKGTMANKAARIMPLELIKGLNDFMRDTNELAEGFEEDSDDPDEMKMGGKVKKCRTGGYVDKYSPGGEIDINKLMQEQLARLQAQQNAPLPYEVGALPQALNMGAGAFGMAALAAQNPISKIYQPDASILRDTAKPFSNAPIKSVFDNAQATQNQAIQNAANTSGVRQQDIPSLFSENNLVNAENQAILGNMQNNAQLGRKYASDIIGWQARGVEGENRNITDLNRHIGQIGTLGADTITNAGNIVAGTQTYKQARDANINENIFNLAQSAQMLKMYESMMPKTNTGSDTSAVPTSNTGTTIDNKGVVRQPVPQQGFESNTSYSNVPPSFLGKSPLTVPGDLNNITAPDEILPQQLPFDPNSFRGVPIDANDGFTYTKNPITGKWTKTKTENKIKNQPYQ